MHISTDDESCKRVYWKVIRPSFVSERVNALCVNGCNHMHDYTYQVLTIELFMIREGQFSVGAVRQSVLSYSIEQIPGLVVRSVRENVIVPAIGTPKTVTPTTTHRIDAVFRVPCGNVCMPGVRILCNQRAQHRPPSDDRIGRNDAVHVIQPPETYTHTYKHGTRTHWDARWESNRPHTNQPTWDMETTHAQSMASLRPMCRPMSR